MLLYKTLLGVLLFSAVNYTSAIDSVTYSNNITCLAETIYRESRGEPLRGKLAVGQVVVNRAKHSEYPDNICAVVFQKAQFSWTKGFKRFVAPNYYRQLATKILKGTHELAQFNATHFHARSVSPHWKSNLTKVATIGNHIFYKL